MLFNYPIELHYSQTDHVHGRALDEFNYPIELHYSQTSIMGIDTSAAFNYPIELHYSQTSNFEKQTYNLRERPQGKQRHKNSITEERTESN